jgi:hypothetical protein
MDGVSNGKRSLRPGRFHEPDSKRWIRLCLGVYGQTYVIQRDRPLQKCAPACWNAVGYDCECSCLGENHGSETPLAHVVSDTFAFQRGGRKLALRLLTRKGAPD